MGSILVANNFFMKTGARLEFRSITGASNVVEIHIVFVYKDLCKLLTRFQKPD